jgi:hypothetical protein
MADTDDIDEVARSIAVAMRKDWTHTWIDRFRARLRERGYDIAPLATSDARAEEAKPRHITPRAGMIVPIDKDYVVTERDTALLRLYGCTSFPCPDHDYESVASEQAWMHADHARRVAGLPEPGLHVCECTGLPRCVPHGNDASYVGRINGWCTPHDHWAERADVAPPAVCPHCRAPRESSWMPSSTLGDAKWLRSIDRCGMKE